MTKPRPHEWEKGVKVLSLLFALLLWLTVMLERDGQVKLQVPIAPEALPAGMSMVTPAPGSLEVTVSGPRILLCRLPLSGMNCRLDLSGARPGVASFTPGPDSFGLDQELKVLRVHPATVSLTLGGEVKQ